jgi:hypothetical protein
MVRLPASTREKKGPTPKPRPCCGHCKQPAKPQAPVPTPLPPGQCPCTDRYSTAPDGPKTVDVDWSLPVPQAVIDLFSS